MSLSIPIVTGAQQTERELRTVEQALQKTGRTAVTTNATIGRSAANMGQRYARAAFQISGVLQAIAATGRTSNDQIKTLIGTASGVAFAFGPTGAIVGAIGLSILAIKELFTKTKEEMKSLPELAAANVDKLKKLTDVEVQRRQRDVDREALLLAGDRVVAAEVAIEEARKQSKGAVGLRAGLASERIKNLQTVLAEARLAVERAQVDLNATEARLKDLEARARAAAIQGRVNDIRSGGLLVGGIADFAGPATQQDDARLSRLRRPGARGTLGVGAASAAAANQQRIVASLTTPATEALQETENIIGTAVLDMSAGIENALIDGFASAFSGQGLGEVFQGFTSSILSSLGTMFIELGKHFIGFGTIMENIRDGLTSFFTTPGAAIAGGVALIALGAAMVGGASAITSGGRARSAGSVGGSARTLTDSYASYGFNPRTMDMTTLDRSGFTVNQFFVVGTNDPHAQRTIGEIVSKNSRRGGRS